MKLAKSLLLGSAAALATAAGAQAADLPVRKAAPVAVEYVRVCSTYGAGFFVLPGTETCLRIGGRVRAEILVQDRTFRGQDYIGMRARGRINIDARTPTPYGVLRAFVGLEATRNSGSPYTGFPGGVAVNDTNLRQAFVQFAGLTAGRVTSFFANGDIGNGQWGTLRFDDGPDITTFAYTFSLGGGFSVSVAAEDPFARTLNNNGFGIGSAPIVGGVVVGPGLFRVDPVLGIVGAGDFVPAGITVGGREWPDFVGNIKYAGTWGNAQLSGAVHQIVDAGTNVVRPGTPLGVINPFRDVARRGDDDIGFAVSGTVAVNLPMIAAGDQAFLAVTYTDGATQYNNGGITGSGAIPGNVPGLQGSLATPGGFLVSDQFINPTNGRRETTETFSVAGGFRHFWVPGLWRSNIFGSYWHVDQGNGDRARAAGTFLAQPGGGFLNVSGTRFGLVSFDEYRIGGNLIWSPVAGLDIGVEVLYARVELDNSRRFVTADPTFGGNVGRFRITDHEDLIEGRIRVQRDF